MSGTTVRSRSGTETRTGGRRDWCGTSGSVTVVRSYVSLQGSHTRWFRFGVPSFLRLGGPTKLIPRDTGVRESNRNTRGGSLGRTKKGCGHCKSSQKDLKNLDNTFATLKYKWSHYHTLLLSGLENETSSYWDSVLTVGCRRVPCSDSDLGVYFTVGSSQKRKRDWTEEVRE